MCVAAYKKEKERFHGQNIVLLMCGGNVSIEVVQSIMKQKP